MTAIRVVDVTTRVDIFRIKIFNSVPGTLYGEYLGTKAPFLLPRRLGNPVVRSTLTHEQAIGFLFSDIVNHIIKEAGPITHMEVLIGDRIP